MENPTVHISDLIITHPEVKSFEGLVELVKAAARAGAINLMLDIQPEYRDTPRGWRDRLEVAFCSVTGGSLRHKGDIQ